MSDGLSCEEVARRDLVSRYVASVLAEPEALALEAHCLNCDTCWPELQTAVEIRAALLSGDMATPMRRDGTASTQDLPASRWRLWVPLALAATVLLGVGVAVVIQHGRSTVPDREPITRGAGANGITVNALQQTDGTIRVEWKADPSASEYQVTVKVSGAIVMQRETTDSELLLPRERFQRGSQLNIEVSAQAADGTRVGVGSSAVTVR